ncbi:hypothetical protein FN976_20445 [Caenimonas sedimenti]|uniref:Uncharacterized protein n=1 Tax=Caenimonas sedimenti TaxID=2596921 RepID=A0A562ZLC0_9BURK|nr:hypothetical protein [Caenimonas sedimenti]TWO69108.1 hypothetical protein FN976_20445 [Caenimonas sedimenti]
MTKQKRKRIAIDQPPRTAGKVLFGLGAVYSSPGVLKLLAKHGRMTAELLAFHQGGMWGEVSEQDAQANDRAVKQGDLIRSVIVVAGVKIYVITEREGADGVRPATTLLLGSE